MTVAARSPWLRRGHSWVGERPWLAGVAAAAAGLLVWAGLAAFGSYVSSPAGASADAEPRPLELPKEFPKPQATDRAYYAGAASPLEAPESERTVLRWRFQEGLPADWRPAPDEGVPQPQLLRTTTGLAVETTSSALGYQLVTTPRILQPGRYVLVLRAGIVSGGLQLGVLDFGLNEWLTTRFFWSGQPGIEGKQLVAPFSLAYATRVQIVLANWARVPRRSFWEVRTVTLGLRSTPPLLSEADRAYYAERAAPTPTPELPQIQRFAFATGVPRSWSAVSGAVLARASRRGAVVVQTGGGRSDYQLQSGALELSAGRYEIVVRGTVADGGMQVGALDIDRDEWVATRTFWQGQNPEQGFVLPFELDQAGPTRIVLANWSPRDRSSEWELTRVELRRRDR